MATIKLHGKNLTGSFNGIDLASASRKFSYKGKGKEIDVTTRDDAVAGSEAYLAAAPGYEFTWEGLDTAGTHAAIATIAIGDVATMTVSNGSKSFSVSATITEQEYDSEHDKAPEWKLAGRFNQKPTWA